jgi:hypothetical protein
MAIPAGTVTDPWDIVAYEAKMLFGLCEVLGDPAAQPGNDLVANAIVESACLHTRILIDILLSKDSGRGDDIRLDQLVPGFRPPSVDRLRIAYGHARTQGSPCWTLNKMVAHPTLKRGTSHDYTGVIRQLLPLIEAVWQDVQSHHQAVLAKLPQAPGGIDPRFCAKTSS